MRWIQRSFSLSYSGKSATLYIDNYLNTVMSNGTKVNLRHKKVSFHLVWETSEWHCQEFNYDGNPLDTEK